MPKPTQITAPDQTTYRLKRRQDDARAPGTCRPCRETRFALGPGQSVLLCHVEEVAGRALTLLHEFAKCRDIVVMDSPAGHTKPFSLACGLDKPDRSVG